MSFCPNVKLLGCYIMLHKIYQSLYIHMYLYSWKIHIYTYIHIYMYIRMYMCFGCFYKALKVACRPLTISVFVYQNVSMTWIKYNLYLVFRYHMFLASFVCIHTFAHYVCALSIIKNRYCHKTSSQLCSTGTWHFVLYTYFGVTNTFCTCVLSWPHFSTVYISACMCTLKAS